MVMMTTGRFGIATLPLLLFSLLIVGCSTRITMSGKGREVQSFDGYPLFTYDLSADRTVRSGSEPQALFFYIQGSDYAPVLSESAMNALSSAAIMGCRVIAAEKRGVTRDSVDIDTCLYYASKEIRIKDHMSVIDFYLREAPPNVPVILMGTSEGGDIAAEVAARETRITHLLLIGTGGGWTQEKELRRLIEASPGYLGLTTPDELDSILAQIGERPNSLELWAGHPFRRWSSYLFDPPVNALLSVDIPIFLAHGADDHSVPVGSARELVRIFEEKGKENLTYREYPGGNHQFLREDGVSILPLLEVDLIEWFVDRGVLSDSEGKMFTGHVRKAHPELFKQ